MGVNRKAGQLRQRRCEKTRKPLTDKQLERIEQRQDERLNHDAQLYTGRVIRHVGYSVWVECAAGLLPCVWRRRLEQIACNDEVRLRLPQSDDNDEHAVIEAIAPRQGTLYKSDFSGHLRPVAAHVDQLLVVMAITPHWQASLLDRYLVAAERAGITATIFINKIELASAEERAELASTLATYRALAYPVLYGSLYEQRGLEDLAHLLQGKTTALCGQSGVGKSSLIQYFLPEADLWIQELSQGQGQHTTTNPTLYHLNAHSHVIDTPGVRSFDIDYLSAEEVACGFREIRARLGQCRFRDCNHQAEALGCAMHKALECGEITEARFNSYLQIINSLQHPT